MNSFILRFASVFLLPLIFLVSFYIFINGEISPGGGFQSGALMAIFIVACDLILADKIKFIELVKNNHKITMFGFAVYFFTGFFALVFGYNFLDYDYIARDIHLAQSIGIILIEVGVTIAVSSGLTAIYFSFK